MSDSVEDLAAAISNIIADLSKFDEGERLRVLRTVSAFFGAHEQGLVGARDATAHHGIVDVPKSVSRVPSVKEFMLEKQPKTDIERLACLGYYLAHYRETPQYKTEDLVSLNFEAAQLRFGNAIEAAKNAVKRGLLIPAGQGRRQLSAVGEQVVEAMPNREAAKAALSTGRPRRKARRRGAGGPPASADRISDE